MGPMGLFQQRSDDEENQWTLPSEPLERSESEVLDTAPTVDPRACRSVSDSVPARRSARSPSPSHRRHPRCRPRTVNPTTTPTGIQHRTKPEFAPGSGVPRS